MMKVNSVQIMKESQLMLESQPPAGAADLPSPPTPPSAPEPPDWDRRAEQLRQQEWEMGQRLIAGADDMLRRLLKQPGRKHSTADIAQLMNSGSQLSRLALGDKAEQPDDAGAPAFHPDLEEALRKVYGEVVSLPTDRRSLSTAHRPLTTNHECQRPKHC